MKKMLTIALSLTMMLSLAACTGNNSENPAPNKPSTAVQEQQGEALEEAVKINMPIPEEYADQLTVSYDTAEGDDEHSHTILTVRETASIEAGEELHPGEDWGDGWLFSIRELDRLGYERMACTYQQGFEFFAKNTEGTKYYVYEHPSDVRLMRSGEDAYNDEALEIWTKLNEWAITMRQTIIDANDNIEAFDYSTEMAQMMLDSSKEHMTASYIDDNADENSTKLTLTLTKTNGDNGVWYVESAEYVDSNGATDVLAVYPAGMGIEKTAEEYYTELQERVAMGETNVGTIEDALKMYSNSDMFWFRGDSTTATFNVNGTEVTVDILPMEDIRTIAIEDDVVAENIEPDIEGVADEAVDDTNLEATETVDSESEAEIAAANE